MRGGMLRACALRARVRGVSRVRECKCLTRFCRSARVSSSPPPRTCCCPSATRWRTAWTRSGRRCKSSSAARRRRAPSERSRRVRACAFALALPLAPSRSLPLLGTAPQPRSAARSCADALARAALPCRKTQTQMRDDSPTTSPSWSASPASSSAPRAARHALCRAMLTWRATLTRCHARRAKRCR